MSAGGSLDATFEALIFDWDRTAVVKGDADTGPLRRQIEALSAAGVHLFAVSGADLSDVDGQLGARPRGPGHLFLCVNRGAEVFEVGAEGATMAHRRVATDAEERALDRTAQATVARLQDRGLEVSLVVERSGIRTIDLIPLPEWANPEKSRISELVDAVGRRLAARGIPDLAHVVALAAEAARAEGLVDARITSDVKHVDIGLTDAADSALYAARWLSERGITGELVLVAGDELGIIGGVPGRDAPMRIEELARSRVVSFGIEPGTLPDGMSHRGGGPAAFGRLLDTQIERRRDRRVPQVDADPRWVVTLPVQPREEHVAESIGALGNGWACTRASREEERRSAHPLLAVAGVFVDDGYVQGPVWTALDLHLHHHGHHDHRLLDLRTGTLVRSVAVDGSEVRTVRFLAASRPGAMALRAEGPPALLAPGQPLRRPPHLSSACEFHRRENDGAILATSAAGRAEVSVAARDRVLDRPVRRTVERVAAWSAQATSCGGTSEAARAGLASFEKTGFDQLLAEHRAVWASLWRDAEVIIEGDDTAQTDELAARFAVFHLLMAATPGGECGVGARGLTGEAYAGHVFWDADVFVLPALSALRPAAARSMLEYRIRRLPAARRGARRLGRSGARFPWESAASGDDVTPRFVRTGSGGVLPILTGTHEEHIVADVAWAAAHYATWVGDETVLRGAARDLVVETARYWAGRIRVDASGRGHIFGVMGPDEYHEVVDDNAYTNVMARWNLRFAAKLLEGHQDRTIRREVSRWRRLAASLVDGWDEQRGIYEQFAGYFGLDPLSMGQFARPPVALDVLLGRDRVARSQLIKQVDVLMLHLLVPGEVRAGSLERCLDFYEPRTAHGSSLSPAVSALLLARAGRTRSALSLLRLAGRLDFDDVTGTTAGGLHLATMGGVWQALAFGFLGLEAGTGALGVDPHLPDEWSRLSLRLRYRGVRLRVSATHDEVEVDCDAPLDIRIAGGVPTPCLPPGGRYALPSGPSCGWAGESAHDPEVTVP